MPPLWRLLLERGWMAWLPLALATLGWLWWRTRGLRGRAKGSTIIEGEYRDETPRPRLEDPEERRL